MLVWMYWFLKNWWLSFPEWWNFQAASATALLLPDQVPGSATGGSVYVLPPHWTIRMSSQTGTLCYSRLLPNFGWKHVWYHRCHGDVCTQLNVTDYQGRTHCVWPGTGAPGAMSVASDPEIPSLGPCHLAGDQLVGALCDQHFIWTCVDYWVDGSVGVHVLIKTGMIYPTERSWMVKKGMTVSSDWQFEQC